MRVWLRNLSCAAAAALLGTSLANAALITGVTDSGSDAAITGGVTSQVENNLAQTIVPFGEDVFAYTDRNHQYNGVRFTAAGVLTATNPPALSDVTVGLPAYLLGGEYVSTRNNNRDNADFRLNVTVGEPVKAFLLIDNRVGKTDPRDNTTVPVLGSKMKWVVDDGWKVVKTGISPNGQPDFIAIDEGGSISDWSARPTANSNLGVGAGVLINNFSTVFMKEFAAGETIALREQNDGGLNMYGLVVNTKPVPEPAAIGLILGAALLGLRRRMA